MSESNQVKKRGWVKNAAIIFLSVMLVLTFFSNTIMNRSLSEVAVEYIQSGTINAKIRGTGTVMANNSYEVIINQTRQVESVTVKVGDTVASGDVLFRLADSQSSELEDAQKQLDSLVLAYRIALINASSSDYAQDNYEIQQLQSKLSKAQADCATYYVSPAELNAAKNEVSERTAEVADLTGELSGLSGEGNADELEQQLVQAENDLDAARIAYRSEMETLQTAAEDKMALDGVSNTSSNLALYMAALAIEYGNSSDPGESAIASAYNAITELEAKVADLEDQIDADTSDEYERVSRKLSAAEEDLEDAQAKLEELNDKQGKWETANSNAESYEQQLNDKLFALAQQEDEENKQQSIDALNLEAQKKEIDEQQQKVNELLSDSVGTEIIANVSGVITAINVTAGNTTESGSPMAVIEVPDMGYTLSFSVTAAQAKKVQVGDTAEVSNYYWGPEITATLSAIKNDPQDPSSSKLLEFRLEGEVDSGSQLSLTLGERSANYELIVPNSALRSDSNGDFVLIVVAKSTPLGNRYIATRVDVNVLASDDTNSAVAGGLTSWDYVITTATKPIEPGQQVRLVEN